jgi:glycosyltransferase involved in cell wall biosynthesis
MKRDFAANKVKLMFCIDFIFGSTEGTENQLIKMINNLDHNKYEIFLLCLRNTPWLEENKLRLKCSVTAFNYNESNHKDPRNLISIWKTVKHMKEVKPDIVIVFFKVSYFLGVVAARLAGVKSIISTRRDYGLWYDDKSLHVLRIINRLLQGIITNSQQVKDLTCSKEHIDPAKVHVIYNGIEAEVFCFPSGPDLLLKESTGIPLNNKVIGLTAGLRTMKNHKTFLYAAKRVLEVKADVSFVLIGDGHLREELENYAKDLAIRQSVYFLGWQTDVPRYLSFFDIGVNCSSMEGLSNAIMEYMASGIPCIVSDAGGNSELIKNGDNGYTFTVGDGDALAELILSLLQDDQKQKNFATRSKTIVQNHMTIQAMISSYEKYFDKIVEKGIYKNN